MGEATGHELSPNPEVTESCLSAEYRVLYKLAVKMGRWRVRSPWCREQLLPPD